MKEKEIFESEFDIMNDFDPELDCVIMSDEDIEKAKEAIANEEDDLIDISIDYSNDIHNPSFIDKDADMLIGAERDVIFEPFDDEEVMDLIGIDDEIDDLEDENIE